MKTLLLLAIAVLLVGCCTPIKPDTIYVDKTVYVKVPETMLVKCKATKPPEVSGYLNADYMGKEDKLTNYAISLLEDIDLCNNQLNSISEYQKNATKDITKK